MTAMIASVVSQVIRRLRDRADAQGGQRRERHLLGDRYTPYQRTDHGP